MNALKEQIIKDFKTLTNEPDTDKIIDYLVNFNILYMKSIKSENPVYKETIYNMIDNMDRYLEHKKISPYMRGIIRQVYINLTESYFNKSENNKQS